MKNEVYYSHQTPPELCKKLIELVPLEAGDRVLEPFRGEGGFYNNLPDFVESNWTEIVDGRDYKDYNEEYEWVITNPPFRMDEENVGKRENTFFKLLKYYSLRAHKGIAFLSNDKCFSSLTPVRLKEFADRGWFIQSITTCSVKAWRGRYFFMILEKKPSKFYNFLSGSF